jgi:hypothetical protein
MERNAQTVCRPGRADASAAAKQNVERLARTFKIDCG